ncbi:MAG: class I SAM-dependent methyltransferase [Parabacteroides merdae]
MDISPGMIEKARSKYATPIVDFRCQDVRDIRGESFDYIIAYSVFPISRNRRTDLPFSRTTAGWRQLVVCHSESRDRINGHHDKHAGKLSEGLPPAEELATHVIPFFTVNTMEDSDRLYMISATRKQTF